MPDEHVNGVHVAMNQLLAAQAAGATAAELQPILSACAALAAKYEAEIGRRRRELASAFVQRRLAERSGHKP